MKTLRGKAVSPGFARGRAFIYRAAAASAVPRLRINRAAVGAEIERFESALGHSVRELEALRARLKGELGEMESGIFEAHLTLLRDPEFVQKVKHRMHQHLINAEQAVELQVQDLEKILGNVENEYLRERAQDIRDVGRRVLKHLGQPWEESESLTRLPAESVLIAEELLPSDTVDLDREHVVALVTAKGGETSHAAILARALGLPYISGVEEATQLIAPGDPVLVDAAAQTVTVSPSDRKWVAFAKAKAAYEAECRRALELELQECATTDGVSVALFANIGRVEDSDSVKQHNLAGVGLFRSEYLFLEEPEPPSLETQRQAYCALARALHPLPLIIRTLDTGGDKRPAFLQQRDPKSVFRGLRFLLAEPELFSTQLRAILHAAQETSVSVLFPMVLGADDLQQAVEMLRAAARREHVDALPRVGAMIETPSALFTIEEILELADFISIGTNDLTQFMLAADRDVAGLVDEYSVLHPSVLRAIAKVIEAARGRGRSVCVCGEAAGDPALAALLVGMGIRELSMSPFRAARVRALIRQTDSSELKAMAREALRAKEIESVKRLLRDQQRQLENIKRAHA